MINQTTKKEEGKEKIQDKRKEEEREKVTTFCPKCNEPLEPKKPEPGKNLGTRYDDYYSNQKK